VRSGDIPQFAVTALAHDDETALVVVQGDVDLHVAGRLQETLQAAASGSVSRVVLDLTRATLFDSSAIHALLVARSFADERATHLAVVCADPSIVRVLEVTSVVHLVPVYTTIAHATDRAAPGAQERADD
jgi:anti-sigma B factor antagonist